MYSKLQENNCYSEHIYLFRIQKNTLKHNTKIQEYVDKIIEAWCYITMVKYQRELDAKRCSFLYYYVGSLLPDNLNFIIFSNYMNMIYNTLENQVRTYNCQMDYPITTDSNIFHQRKKIFDYFYDYNDLQKLISNSGNECSKKYGGYLKEVEEAYSSVRNNCISNMEYDYCKEFENKYGRRDGQKLPVLACSTVQEVEPSSDTEGEESSSQKVPTANSAHRDIPEAVEGLPRTPAEIQTLGDAATQGNAEVSRQATGRDPLQGQLVTVPTPSPSTTATNKSILAVSTTLPIVTITFTHIYTNMHIGTYLQNITDKFLFP
ncbi:hypothetical protein PCYB_003120 [Plasmodium cynomolgi strain B]|uniref:CYIR protein n=1 Tax=Plasmodium cynomolgi (strain B) TaxID=1120755 RepID=K6UNJ8_PLACD|nr:hypothetical protein PCYB_003120 [Plasmodium cynomolgi strain B]GAB69563.1 hypothetical protein PCYB_003120 [Plasmodium cynomolgi strain B]